MMAEKRKKMREQSRFPMSLFFAYFIVLLLMSGMHIGLLTFMDEHSFPTVIEVNVPLLYWALIAAGLTLFTRWRIRITYDSPMTELAAAARQVANGDFSVYVPPVHTLEKQDYLDVMIEDFNKMIAELGSIETLKTDFFSNVSHEFKTPLAVIQSNAELLYKNRQMTKERREECAEHILAASKRLSKLITNMLKLNKLEKQTIAPVPVPYDLCAQLSECALQFEEVWEKKGIDFEAELEDRAMVEADEELMALVWTNLLSNALKFTPEGGRVTISQTTGEEAVTVCISDTGCGMSAETMRHIFDKFYQGDTSHSTEGNGLGLALVHRILQLSKGSVTVSSEEGKGSQFTVKVPRRNHTNGTE